MDFKFSHNQDEHLFELLVDNKDKAIISYSIVNNKFYLNHIIVPKELSGLGIGKILATNVFNYIKENNLQAVAICSYLVALVSRNSEWSFIELL